MSTRAEINPPVGPDVQRVLTAMSAECAAERERAVRWEALARTLGDAAAAHIDGPDTYAVQLEDASRITMTAERALSVYRDAIGESDGG